MVFTKKIEAIEKAMSWYQEALDCYAMLRSSCNELKHNIQIFLITSYAMLVVFVRSYFLSLAID